MTTGFPLLRCMQIKLHGTNIEQLKVLSSGCSHVDVLMQSVTLHLRQLINLLMNISFPLRAIPIRA